MITDWFRVLFTGKCIFTEALWPVFVAVFGIFISQFSISGLASDFTQSFYFYIQDILLFPIGGLQLLLFNNF